MITVPAIVKRIALGNKFESFFPSYNPITSDKIEMWIKFIRDRILIIEKSAIVNSFICLFGIDNKIVIYEFLFVFCFLRSKNLHSRYVRTVRLSIRKYV